MKIVSYADRAKLAWGVAAAVSIALKKAIEAEGRASLCLAGGTTPGPMFDILAGATIDWSKVTVFLSDERWVDDRNKRSNAALVKKRLLVGAAQKAKFIGFYAKGKTPEAAAAALGGSLAPHLPITVLLAGMGEDMHTASLFPDGDNLAAALAADAPTALVMNAPTAGEARITLSAPVLAAAAHIHLMISGDAKREAVMAAENLPLATAPVGAILPRADVHWAA